MNKNRTFVKQIIDSSDLNVFQEQIDATDVFKPFQCGDRLYTSESEVCRRQYLNSVDVRIWRIKTIPAVKQLTYF